MKKIKVTAVSYLNTKPLLYGILHSNIAKDIQLSLDIPSVCAQKLADGTADLGLIPVAVMPDLQSPRIISDYCIGTIGEVRTVCIFSERPLEQLDRIFLDYHSRTSAALTQVLLKEYWDLQPEVVNSWPGFEEEIGGRTGGLIIGDRAIEALDKYPYAYDLGTAWQEYTGLPFVFAAWVSNASLPESFIDQFNQALQRGLEAIPQLMYLLTAPHPGFDLEAYYTRHISYELDEPKRIALKRFLKSITDRPMPSLYESLAVG